MRAGDTQGKRRPPCIVGTGLISLDVVINGERTPRLAAGGTCGNVLAILSYLGWKARPVARLNDDLASATVLKDLKRCGVSLEFIRCKPLSDTPIIVHRIRRDRGGKGLHRFSFHCPTCGSWYPGFRAVHATAARRIVPILGHVDVFFFDRVSRSAIVLAQECAVRGALIVFEPSANGDPRLMREAISVSHVLKYASERMRGRMPDGRGAHLLLEIETHGCDGLRFRSNLQRYQARKWQQLDASQVGRVTDAAGAGDWCTAGIIHKLGRGGFDQFRKTTKRFLVEALTYGQAGAAWNCKFEGARGGMEHLKRNAFQAAVRRIISGKVPKPRIARDSEEGTEILACLCPMRRDPGTQKRVRAGQTKP